MRCMQRAVWLSVCLPVLGQGHGLHHWHSLAARNVKTVTDLFLGEPRRPQTSGTALLLTMYRPINRPRPSGQKEKEREREQSVQKSQDQRCTERRGQRV